MARKTKIAAGCLNVRLHPHSRDSYVSWLSYIFARRITVNFHGDRYAILFSLINSRLKSALRNVQSGHGPSWLEVINATFFHFIFVQVIALTWAFAFQGSILVDAFSIIDNFFPSAANIFPALRAIGSFVGYLLLIYSFLLTIAAALVIYRLATINDPADDAP